VTKRSADWLLLLLAFACPLAAVSGCRRQTHRGAPAASASVAATQAPTPPRLPEPLPRSSAIVPSAAAFADGGAPVGYERATVWDLVPTGDGAAVLLLDSSGTTVLPIFVGSTEALTIRLDMDGHHYERPLTHDLLSSLVRELGGVTVKAQIDDQRDDTYYGSVFVRQGERVLQLDARPSDAIAIALGNGTPLYVSRSVLLTSGVSREEIDNEDKEKKIEKRKKGNPI
jgi:bifunctional DNase/RNase